ncbi:MAG: NAD(+) diphosphatase [Gammaproteobacteria bacterium]|jgi:NAD+ diphosphatase
MPTFAPSIVHNFLAGPYIDRRAESREAPDWQQAALADPDTLFLLARGTAHPIAGEGAADGEGTDSGADGQPRVAFVGREHPLVQAAPREALVLLGWFQRARCVLVQLGDDAPPPPGARYEELRPLAAMLDGEQAGLLAYARALTYWQHRHRHCGVCGARCEPQRAGHVMRCRDPGCATDFFPRIDPAIIVLVTDGERALLGRQASWPTGRFSTVAGFVEPGESLEDAVVREVLEETGVAVQGSRYHSSQPWPFPSSLMLGFTATAAPGAPVIPSTELEEAHWFTRESIAAGEVMLPPATSISHRLIAEWFDAAWPKTLGEVTAGRPWGWRKR